MNKRITGSNMRTSADGEQEWDLPQPEPHAFVPMSHSDTGVVTCSKHYQLSFGRGVFCAEPPDHPIHNVVKPDYPSIDEEFGQHYCSECGSDCGEAERQRDKLVAQRDAAENLLVRLYSELEELLRSRGLL
jgi:hypothetical protein